MLRAETSEKDFESCLKTKCSSRTQINSELFEFLNLCGSNSHIDQFGNFCKLWDPKPVVPRSTQEFLDLSHG